jgi:hypothetical protein
MKKLKGIFAALALTAGLVCASDANAQLVAHFNAAGSSAQYNTFALAALNQSQLCGTNFWTQKNGVTLNDPRNGAILPEKGNIWIVWNNQATTGAANSIVCYYVSVDSIVGVRAYFANATVQFVAGIGAGTGSDNSVPYLGAGIAGATDWTAAAGGLPAPVAAFVAGSKINFAATDIRPEDAKFASNRALTAYGALMTGRGFTGVGYQGLAATPWLGVPIVSSVSTAQANPVDFAFVPGDTDPVTHVVGTRNYAELPVGAAPVMVVVNRSNVAAGHMGDPALAINDIPKQILSNVLIGQIGHVRDLSSNTNAYANDAALHVWVREPLSGTYNTMDFNVPNSNDIAGDYAQAAGRVTGQESGINTLNVACVGAQTAAGCPAESGNPLFHFITPAVGAANGSTRGRVIGSGEMIKTVNANADSLGYSFWGFSSFNGVNVNLKYLTVNGVDPLYSGPAENPGGLGALPQCPATPCLLPFTNIKNGSYPIWSKYRAVYDNADALNLAPNLVTLAQAASTAIYSDFVPASALNVFRSHFAQVVTTTGGGYPANNGIVAGVPETGGDMGGQVLTIQSEQDFIADTGGNQQVNMKI